MTRKPDDTDIMGIVFTAELRSESYLVRLLKYLFLEFHIPEGTSCLVSRGRKRIIIVRGSEFDREQVLLG